MSCLNRVCIDVRVCVIYYVTIGTVRGHGAQALSEAVSAEPLCLKKPRLNKATTQLEETTRERLFSTPPRRLISRT